MPFGSIITLCRINYGNSGIRRLIGDLRRNWLKNSRIFVRLKATLVPETGEGGYSGEDRDDRRKSLKTTPQNNTKP